MSKDDLKQEVELYLMKKLGVLTKEHSREFTTQAHIDEIAQLDDRSLWPNYVGTVPASSVSGSEPGEADGSRLSDQDLKRPTPELRNLIIHDGQRKFMKSTDWFVKHNRGGYCITRCFDTDIGIQTWIF